MRASLSAIARFFWCRRAAREEEEGAEEEAVGAEEDEDDSASLAAALTCFLPVKWAWKTESLVKDFWPARRER
jgi:hypothetical protein